MIKQTLVALSIIAVVSTYSCSGSKKTAAAPAPPVNDTINEYLYKRVLKDKELYGNTTDVLPIDTAYISRDTLHVLTGKLQACDAENFDLIWSGMMTKSLPPQIPVKLFLLNDPTCKEQHRFHLTFNTKPMHPGGENSKGSAVIKLSGMKTGITCSY